MANKVAAAMAAIAAKGKSRKEIRSAAIVAPHYPHYAD